MGLSEVIRLAASQRQELSAAHARVRASVERPAVVSALEDPMISASIDHKPFNMRGMDYSFAIEQRIPLGSLRQDRRQSAEADIARLRAEAEDKQLGVAAEAASAFLMLQQRRRTAELLHQRREIARAIVAAADARYGGGTGEQADVLRAEVEVARVEAQLKASTGRVAAAEAMLNASLGQEVDRPVRPLRPPVLDRPAPTWAEVEARLPSLPRLQAGRAEIGRSEAEVRVMRDMYKPMATVRAGPAYDMDNKWGAMLMVGVSVPIWRSKLSAGVREAEAMREMSRADLRAMTRMAEGEAAQALNELKAAGELQRSLRAEIGPRARFAIDPALAAYAAGRQPLVSVMEALQTLWSVENELIDADMQVGLAWVRLGRATGSYELITL
ncbi:MAG: TolC family protein [Phenylobacterium sp.]|uniref:TolC family protein n=1 Tax=Phenylobacterium sp. TaxID=1871053 RepID=UPI002728A76B|nr:TolC family protein [Phenylobacterium sp.]MDO8324693.1 TolC family protein [Phenylobacterium sp.]MDO8912569.1 TolC family protein [Phenylobacterium sp.]MDO9246599.1 TolC family protein [Phenylobacterium sp.]MDP3101626.1 TolC family protein [Phenylobacterium sp.]